MPRLVLFSLALLLLLAPIVSSLTGCALGTSGPDCCGISPSGDTCSGLCYDPSEACCFPFKDAQHQPDGVVYGNGSCIDDSESDAPRFCTPNTSGCSCSAHYCCIGCPASHHGSGGLSQGGKIAIAVFVVLFVVVIAVLLLYCCWYKKRSN